MADASGHRQGLLPTITRLPGPCIFLAVSTIVLILNAAGIGIGSFSIPTFLSASTKCPSTSSPPEAPPAAVVGDSKLPPPRQLTDPPYSLGPVASDYDDRRASWLHAHPSFSSRAEITNKKPRVLLVTGSSPAKCPDPDDAHFLLLSLKNKVDYCRIHGIDIFYSAAFLDAEMDGFWAKLPLIRSLLVSHPEVELLWWMDSDALFTDMAFEVPWERYANYNMVLHGWEKKVYEEKDWVGLNTGSFLIRNCRWSLELLAQWALMGPRGPVREAAGKTLHAALTGRPEFDGDDQSALIYTLVTQQERWREKVYLESSYYLHGYWGILVDRYEEMRDKWRPGFGDDRWPLVTHFVGCKPCGQWASYPVERCRQQMERAFNFADDQILRMYGFEHAGGLRGAAVRRVGEDTGLPPEGCCTLPTGPQATQPREPSS